jgi:hypothetical protein
VRVRVYVCEAYKQQAPPFALSGPTLAAFPLCSSSGTKRQSGGTRAHRKVKTSGPVDCERPGLFWARRLSLPLSRMSGSCRRGRGAGRPRPGHRGTCFVSTRQSVDPDSAFPFSLSLSLSLSLSVSFVFRLRTARSRLRGPLGAKESLN